MEKALKFLLYSLGLSVLFLSISVEKDKTIEIVLGVSIVIGFLFGFFALSKLRENKKEDCSNDKNN